MQSNNLRPNHGVNKKILIIVIIVSFAFSGYIGYLWWVEFGKDGVIMTADKIRC